MELATLGLAVDSRQVRTATNDLDRLANTGQRTERQTDQIGAAFKRAAGPIAAFLSVRQISQATEQWTTLNNRLRLVTDSVGELASAQDAVFQIAQRSRQPLMATAELYQRIAMNADELRLSGAGVAGVVDTINKTLAVSGASAQSANAALIQLGQAFGSGVLRGEEFNSVMEQAPALAYAIADGMGVARGALRQMAHDGALTAEVVIAALQKQAGAVDDQFGKVQATVGQAVTVFGSSFTRLVGQFDEATGSSARFADQILGLSNYLDSGQLLDGALQALSIWRGTIDSAASATGDLSSEIEFLEDTAVGAGGFIADAFINMPANITTAIKVATVEIAGLIDRAGSAVQTLDEALAAIVTDDTVSAAFTRGEARYQALLQVREDSIQAIFDEREAILSAADAEQSKREQERKLREESRAEREKEIGLIREQAKQITITGGVSKKESKDAERAAKRQRDAEQSLLDTLYPIAAITRRRTQDQKTLNDMYEAGRLSLDEYTKATSRLSDTYAEVYESAYGTLSGVDEKVEESANLWDEALQGAAERIDSAFVDMWKNIGGGFDDFADSLKDAFKQLLAELAHQAITRKIVVNFASSLGMDASSLGGGSSGGSSGNFLNMASTASSLWGGVSGIGSAVGSGWAAGGFGGAVGGMGNYIGAMLGNQASQLALMETSMSAILNGSGNAIAAQGAGAGTGAMGNLGSSMGAMWPLAVIAGMIQSGKLYDAGFKPDGSDTWGKADGQSAFQQAAWAGPSMQSYLNEWVDKAIGSVVGGKAAGMITGSPITQWINDKVGSFLFGKEQEVKNYGIELGASGDDLTGQNWRYMKKDGGAFGSTKRWYEDAPLAADYEAGLQSMYDDTLSGVRTYFDAIGVEVSQAAVDGFSVASERISLEHKTDEEISQIVAGWFGSAMESMVSAFGAGSGIDGLSSERLIGLAGGLTNVNATMERLRGTLLDVSPAGALAAESLLQLVGGFDVLAAAQQQYYDLYFSEQEKFQHLQEDLTAAFGGINQALPDTAAQFRALVEAQDLMTEAGREQYVALLALAPSVKQYTDALDAQARAAEQAAEASRNAAEAALQAAEAQAQAVRDAAMGQLDALVSGAFSALQKAAQAEQAAINQQITAANGALQQAENIASLLGRSLRSMRLQSDALDRQRRQMAQASLVSSLAIYRAGGPLPGAADLERQLSIIAEPSEQLFGSFEDYMRDFWQTANVISDLEQAAGKQVTIEQATLAELETHSAALDGILANAQSQLDALNGVETGLLSVAEALAQFQGVLGQAGRAPKTPSTDPVESLYRDILGRAPDAEGQAYWNAQLATGALNMSNLESTFKAAAAANPIGLDEYRAKYGDAAAARLAKLRGIPGFASGGIHAGGWRVVGEQGPELEYTPPSQIFSNSQSKAMLGNESLAAEIRQMRADMREQNRAIAVNSMKTAKILERWDYDGQPEMREAMA